VAAEDRQAPPGDRRCGPRADEPQAVPRAARSVVFRECARVDLRRDGSDGPDKLGFASEDAKPAPELVEARAVARPAGCRDPG